ncbi:MAG: tetratricopeptide repeat protein, partial [Deltaproteobacteria bacterium]
AGHYEQAVRLGVKDQALYHNLAYTYTKLGREKEAVVYYEKISPPTRKTLGIIANYHLKNKNTAQAIKYYQRIVKLEPKKASSYFSLGFAYAAAGDWDKAIAHYQTALKYDTEDDVIYANLGLAYEKKELYAEALKAYKNAYEINPETKVAGKIPRLRILMMQKKE